MLTNSHPLKNKIAIITGADSGIGKACALELSERGADILINYHNDMKGAQETLKLVQENGSRGIIFKADVGDYSQIQQLFQAAKNQLGIPYIY